MKRVAIIVSAFNEEDNIEAMYKEVMNNVDSEYYSFDVCYVDDGSRDNSYKKMKELASVYDNIKILKFKRNFGHETSMIAGVDYFKGYDYYIVLDCDLQHPPKYIMDMLRALDDGHDAVLMRREKNNFRNSIISSFAELYYDIINIIFREKFVKNVSDYIGFNDKVASVLRTKYRYNDRLIRYIIQKVSDKPIIIDYSPIKRERGESKYSFTKYTLLAIKSLKALHLMKKDKENYDLYYEVDEENSIK